MWEESSGEHQHKQNPHRLIYGTILIPVMFKWDEENSLPSVWVTVLPSGEDDVTLDSECPVQNQTNFQFQITR